MTGSRLGVLCGELYLTFQGHIYIWSMIFVFRSCFHLGNMTKKTQKQKQRSACYSCVRHICFVVAYGIHTAVLEKLAILTYILKDNCFFRKGHPCQQ